MRRYNVGKMNVTRKPWHPVRKKHAKPVMMRPPGLLLQYSQQQAQVEGQIAAARQSAGIATDRMTEAHKQLLALQQRISDLDGKKTDGR